MSITTMICVLTGILVAGFVGVTFITQWAQIQKSKKPAIFDWLKEANKKNDDHENE